MRNDKAYHEIKGIKLHKQSMTQLISLLVEVVRREAKYTIGIVHYNYQKDIQLIENEIIRRTRNAEREVNLKAYVGTFVGHYPVGGEAVIVAETPRKALNALNRELAKMGLKLTSGDNIYKIDMNSPSVDIMNDGDY